MSNAAPDDPEAVHMFNYGNGGTLCKSQTGEVATSWSLVTCTKCRQVDMVSQS